MRKNLTIRAAAFDLIRRTALAAVAAILLAGMLFAGQPVSLAQAAADCTTTDFAANWNDKISWDCLVYPAAGNITINHELVIDTDQSVDNLTINSDGAALIFQGGATLTVYGDIIINGGDLSMDGQGSIVLAGDVQSIRTNGKWLDIWSLSKTTGSSLSVDPAVVGDTGELIGGLHVLNALTLQGVDANNLLALRSTVAGETWQILVDDNVSVTLDYLDVQDSSDSVRGINPLTVATGVSSGHNSGWILGTVPGTLALEVALEGLSPIQVFDQASFEAVVSPVTPGTVEFQYGGVTIPSCGSVAVDGFGAASCKTNALPVGTHTISAVFTSSIDASKTKTSDNSVTQVIDPLGVSVITGLFEETSVAANGTTATVNFVSVISPMGNNGVVAFKADGSDVAGCEAVNVNKGRAVCSTAMTPGAYAITTVYNAITSNPMVQVVNKASAVLASSQTPNRSSYVKPHTFKATITVPGSAQGTITFRNHNLNIVGCIDLPVVNNEATCTLLKPLTGNYQISAVYSGDPASFVAPASSSQPVLQLIQAIYYSPLIGK